MPEQDEPISMSEQIAQRVVSLLKDAGADEMDVLGFVAILSNGVPALYAEDGLARVALLGAMEMAKDELLCIAQQCAEHGDDQ